MSELAERRLWWLLIIVFLVGINMLASGCILSSLGVPGLTPAQVGQVKAMQDMNLDVYVCFQIAGPPPAGGLAVIGVPKGVAPSITWGGNCQPIQAGLK